MSVLNLSGLLRGFFSAVLLSFVLVSQAAENGLLWKAEAPTGKVSYLFGTMHTDDSRINDFSPALVEALTKSEVFIMETLPAGDPSIYLMDADLRKLLNEKELEQVHALADLHSMHEEAAMHMKPWLLAIVFDLPKPQSAYTQDAQLLGMSQSSGKEVLGLEDINEHFAVLDSFPLEDHLTMLRAVLKRSQEDKERDYEALLEAYLKGDTAKIAKLDDRITGDMLPKGLWTRMRVKLIDERNARMAERIISEAGERSAFVAVGASHLPGKDGLVERLRRAGYKLAPVNQKRGG